MTISADSRDMLPLAVVADDLTGAMDSGLQFARQGLETLVQLAPGSLPSAPVIAVSTESRDLPPSAAIAQIHALVPRLSGRRLFKKIDSTLRGNTGYELRALLNLLSLRAVVVAPAFPQGGRTTVQGQQRIEDVPLALTAFRNDPRWPMVQSDIPAYLMQQAGTEVALIALDTVTQGAEAIARALSRTHARLIVADAVTDVDLQHIATAVRSLGPDWLPCGSAGLAQAWATLLGQTAPAPVTVPPRAGRGLLFVIGSRNPVVRAQVQALLDTGLAQVTLHSAGSYEPQVEAERLAGEVCTALSQGQDTVLEASSAPLIPGGGPRVADILARVVAMSVSQRLVGGLFLTGGEIALAVCRALGVEALRIVDAIEPGVPGGQLVGGLCDGLPAVTKAGGFGSQGALLAARGWLQDMRSHPSQNDNQEGDA